MSLLVARSIFEELHTSARFLSIASRRLPDPLAAVTAERGEAHQQDATSKA